ncbi:tumor necrosis factor receptor superfamily member 1B isoform X2 [Pimephales promelas]|uniref:tumor necrosis factor receptor superfamily member 1B isoform X2 n=1 Tax=Pimephales promelas TaxID=90988 RepID=UPI001955E479|nr:tumor necrosis factor receptor superfamily member 1B isoform X2 [Pimephales promelas]KAG1950239.1 tumor necrosis factor receptor superfamily member 1B [Pimephales promelas]KAG1950242.1 tumor necrosis factor receptor superfamily member 1B [Pimephales promelas]
MTPSTSTRSTFILLFYLIFPCMHASCPTKCPNGYNNKRDCECNSNCYRKSRMGILTCQYCTPVCSEAKNQVEVTPCTQESNRNCACKPGFYCKEGNNYSTYCHKPCVPCETGTFSSKPSLDPACKPHKDCAQLGMITLKEGTATRDRECVYATTKMAASSTASVIITTISSETIPTPRTVKRSLGTEGTSTQDTEGVNATTKMAASSTSPIIITTISSETTPTPRTEGNRQQRDADPKESQSSWLLLLILLLMLLFMTGFCMLMKGKALKTLSKCFGLIHGEHEEQQHWRQKAGDHHILSNSQSDTSTDHSMDSERPLGSDVGQVKGQSMGVAPQSSGVQQVTVKHNGKGENVSNTVGSIYIYSPGTVILGSNSGDKKEEAGVGDEALPLISAPQQESNPPSQEVRITMSAQEEAEEELSLSFPVPATGK